MHDGREPTGLSPVLQDAQRLASSGRTIFPCKPDKTPLVAWKRAATTDPATIQNWWKRWPDAMIGLPTGHGLAVFDIDVDKATGKTFGEATARRMGLWELIRQGLLVNTPSGGLHAYFAGDVATSTGTIGPGIDTRGRGGYVIAPGSVNAHGTYRWETLCLTDVALPPLPGGLSDALSMERSFGVAGKLDQARSGAPPSLAGADEVREILSWIDPDAGGYTQWCKVLMGLHDHFAGSEEGLSIAEGWSSHGAKFRPREVPAKWASFQSGAGISIRTICEIARSNGADLALVARKHRAYGLSADSTQPERLRPASALSAHPATADAPGPSDDALALSFAAVHVSGLRFVAPWGRWMVWTGKRWRPDESLAAFDLVRAICRKAAEQCDKPGRAAALASAKTVAAVERLAKADRRLAATTDQWDADRWLLNTPDGAVDLKTGKQRPHEWGDYLTRMTAMSPHGGCPTWLRFLDDVCGGDDALTAYLKRLAGYALTGSTREQNLAFLHGTGGNGKSVFLGTLANILGDYHKTAPIETFTASTGGDRHPTELAMLRGARLVTAVETEEGRRWAESRIKSLTGGDPIAARYMRQDFFEFTPQFKLLIAGNHKPGLRSVDEAIRRRLHLVPFTVTIPRERRDADLSDKLRAEWPGILAWAVEGCLEWQERGLAPPTSVLAATEEYLEGQDAIGAWLDDACDVAGGLWASRNDLLASWKAWAEKNGEFVVPRARFFDALESRGFQQHRRKNGRGYNGIAVRPYDCSDAHWQR